MEGDAGAGRRLNPPPMSLVVRQHCDAHPLPHHPPAVQQTDRSETEDVIGLGQLRSHALTYLERVATGETINVVRRGKLVARIVSVGDWRVAPIPARSATDTAADARAWVGLDELRTRAGRCFDRVAAGETIQVVRGGRLLAQIVSAGHSTMASNPADTAGPIELDELRARTGRYLDRAAAGDEIEIVRGGRVVARIVSAVGDSPKTSASRNL
jgi:prevent-host-death family protein